jgi:hypothetical protein
MRRGDTPLPEPAEADPDTDTDDQPTLFEDGD